MRSVRENAVPPEPHQKTRFATVTRAVASIVSAAILAGCSGASPGPFEEAEDLQVFLKGEAPVPTERAELARLNEAFARQSVRAHGYLREGVGDVPPDGWSPVVRGADGDPVDITPWIEGGDIDPAGRFNPGSELCEASGPASIEGLPEDALRLDELQARLNRLSCAIDRLAGGATEIQWFDPSTSTSPSPSAAAAVSIGEPGGAALVNPRVVHLIFPIGEAPGGAAPLEAPGLEPAGAGPEDDDEILIDEADLNPHHPRPPPDPDDGDDTSSDIEDFGKCVDACAVGCELLVVILDACGDSSSAASADSSGDCDSSVPGQRPGPLQPLLFSLGLVVSIGLRRRSKRRRGRSLFFLAPIAFSLMTGGPARAQTPPKAAAPPPPPDPAEPAPPVAQRDWKQLHQEGLKKLEEKNYGDAVRLLQEAYLLNPTVDKLEAIAHAQRGAGQTQKAIQTLEHARAQFGESLTPEKYDAFTADIEKWKGELVPVRIITRPIYAKISIDGEELPSGAAGTPIELGAGSHKFGASAPGYAAGFKTVDIGPGSGTRDVILKLPPNKIFLRVKAPDESSTIALDGKEVGKGEWSDFVEPGVHTVKIQQTDGTAQTFDVNGAAGQALRIPDEGAPLTYPGMPEPEREGPGPSSDFSDMFEDAPAKAEFREAGPYFLANASILWHTTRLYGFEDPNLVPGVGIGIRGGYRPYSTLSFELLVEYSYFGRTDELTQLYNRDEDGDGYKDHKTARDDATYAIHDVRLGPVLRLMTDHPKHRGVFGLGLGVLYEQIALEHVDYKYNDVLLTWNDVGTYRHDYGGVGAFLLAEVGYERSIGNLILGGIFNVFVDAVGGINGEPYDEASNVRLGVAFRVGYSLWKMEPITEKKKPSF